MLGEWSVLSVPGDRAVHDVRVDLPHALVVHAETTHHTGPEPLDHDVGLRRRVEHRLLPRCVLQVHGRAALPRVEHGEQRRKDAHRVAAGRLDLHDVCAQLDEQLGRVRARSPDAEVEDAHAGQETALLAVGHSRHDKRNRPQPCRLEARR
jgi:hypothetical protein